MPAPARDSAEPSAAAAAAAGLVYVNPGEPGFSRRRSGRGFTYLSAKGRTVHDPQVLERIRKLVIPPAWTEVWICSDPSGHLQATGFDQKGRRQYLYHPGFREVRDAAKFEHLIGFGKSLPAIRRRLDLDLRRHNLDRAKVLATVVSLLDSTLIRIGNAAYEQANGSYGLTTLRNRHVQAEGGALKFHFKGKSGKVWRLELHDRRVANVVRRCQELPGQHLFQYRDGDGILQSITSADVNAYLKAIGGDITAKDFRTWHGTLLAAAALRELGAPTSPTDGKRKIAQAMRAVSARLGNTPAVCRQGYVHPAILETFLGGDLGFAPARASGLAAAERALLRFLRRRTPSARS
ncbi:MAG: DNA topoisomerase IB [Proteobacteria bacterium]|nr:DNA topoisomerase IB [Pseudomonadota bacterium]